MSEFPEDEGPPGKGGGGGGGEIMADEDKTCVKGSQFIGEYLFELWKNQCLCDVKLQVGEKSFLAHKVVLAAFSDVFCPSQPRIRPTVCIDVPNTSPDAVYQILLYLYTSEMHLTDCNLEAVLNAACFMGVTDVVDMVKAILDHPTVENAQLYMDIRRRQGMPHSLLDFPKLCRENFTDLVDTQAFLCMTFEELETLLKVPSLMVTSEMDTVRGVINWLEFNPLGRTQHTAKLLELVNLECVDTDQLVQLREEKQHLFNDVHAAEVIMDAFIKRAMACADRGNTGYFSPNPSQSQFKNVNIHLPVGNVSHHNVNTSRAHGRPSKRRNQISEVSPPSFKSGDSHAHDSAHSHSQHYTHNRSTSHAHHSQKTSDNNDFTTCKSQPKSRSQSVGQSVKGHNNKVYGSESSKRAYGHSRGDGDRSCNHPYPATPAASPHRLSTSSSGPSSVLDRPSKKDRLNEERQKAKS